MAKGYILYRGSRDELNEMCRVKDERIAELEAALAAASASETARNECTTPLVTQPDGSLLCPKCGHHVTR